MNTVLVGFLINNVLNQRSKKRKEGERVMETKVPEKNIFGRHKAGLIGAVVSFVIMLVLQNIYNIFKASFEASMAVKQLDDSIFTYSLVQKLIYGNLAQGAIRFVGVIIIILCLLPMVIDAISNQNQQS